MATWGLNFTNLTPVLVADTTAYTNDGYVALIGGSGTQRIVLYEVKIGGLAASAAPMQLVLARDSTVGVTLVAGKATLTADDPATAALAAPPLTFTQSTTKPNRLAPASGVGGYLRDLSFNAYGGLVRFQLPPDKPIGLILGNTANFGEASISSLNQGTAGLCGGYMVVEPL